jgi:hypothetical protein
MRGPENAKALRKRKRSLVFILAESRDFTTTGITCVTGFESSRQSFNVRGALLG